MRLNRHENTTTDYRRARALRNGASPVEQKLWSALRAAAKSAGLKFRRQQPLHPYVADFACMSAKLVVEIDGDTHAGREGYDAARDEKIREMGFFVLHFCNDDVVHNAEGVAETIVRRALLLNAPHPNPPREGEGTASLSFRSGHNNDA